jgi:predicted small lipoprotein YifL
LIGPLAAALALAACGRKGGLDAPPSAAVAQPAPAEPTLGEAPAEQPFFSGFVRPPQPEPAPPAGAPQPPPKRTFLLDWLL